MQGKKTLQKKTSLMPWVGSGCSGTQQPGWVGHGLFVYVLSANINDQSLSYRLQLLTIRVLNRWQTNYTWLSALSAIAYGQTTND